jgi:glycosyltransferase involved in cell wall biosynthesis
MGKKVSILVPVYGVERYVGRCAESLFGQDYEDVEYVFVDDCTKDDSVGVIERTLERYQERKEMTQIIHHERNRGLSAARNTALEASSGDYLMIVDSDDWLADKGVVRQLVEKMEATGADIVVFDHVDVWDEEKESGEVRHKDIPKEKDAYLKFVLECRCTPSLATSMYRASLWKENGVRNIEGLDMSEDYTVQPKLIYYAKKIVYVREGLYCYNRANEGSYINRMKPSGSTSIPEMDAVEAFFADKADRRKYAVSLRAGRLVKEARWYVNWAKYSGEKDAYDRIPRMRSAAYVLNGRLMLKYKVVIAMQRLHLEKFFLKYVRKQMQNVQ